MRQAGPTFPQGWQVGKVFEDEKGCKVHAVVREGRHAMLTDDELIKSASYAPSGWSG
jgi:hypothetical protein